MGISLAILFGTDVRVKDHGPVGMFQCDCGQTAALHLGKSRRWLTAWFLPLVPLAEARYWLLCSACGRGYEVADGDASSYRIVANALDRYQNGALDQQACIEEIDRMKSEVAAPEILDSAKYMISGEFEQDVLKAREQMHRAEQRVAEFDQCPECSAMVEMSAEFCPDCGAELPAAEVECKSCGSMQAPGDAFCADCGDELEIEIN